MYDTLKNMKLPIDTIVQYEYDSTRHYLIKPNNHLQLLGTVEAYEYAAWNIGLFKVVGSAEELKIEDFV